MMVQDQNSVCAALTIFPTTVIMSVTVVLTFHIFTRNCRILLAFISRSSLRAGTVTDIVTAAPAGQLPEGSLSVRYP